MPSATEVHRGPEWCHCHPQGHVPGQPYQHPSAMKWNELSQPHQVQRAIELLDQLGKVLLEALATHLNIGFFLHMNTGFQAKQAKQGSGE